MPEQKKVVPIAKECADFAPQLTNSRVKARTEKFEADFK